MRNGNSLSAMIEQDFQKIQCIKTFLPRSKEDGDKYMSALYAVTRQNVTWRKLNSNYTRPMRVGNGFTKQYINKCKRQATLTSNC